MNNNVLRILASFFFPKQLRTWGSYARDRNHIKTFGTQTKHSERNDSSLNATSTTNLCGCNKYLFIKQVRHVADLGVRFRLGYRSQAFGLAYGPAAGVQFFMLNLFKIKHNSNNHISVSVSVWVIEAKPSVSLTVRLPRSYSSGISEHIHPFFHKLL